MYFRFRAPMSLHLITILKEPDISYILLPFLKPGVFPNKIFSRRKTIGSPLKASLWLWLPKWHSDRLAQLLSTDRNLSHGRGGARANSLIAPKTLISALLSPCFENSVWWYAFQIEIITCHLPMLAFILSFALGFFCYQLFQVFQFLKISFTYHAYC